MNILAGFLEGQRAGLANREYRTQQANKSRLSELAPQIMAGDPSAYSQAAAIDPKAAQGYQDAGDAQLRKLQGFIKYVDGARATGNAAAVRAALQQGAPFIQQLTGKPAPTDWTPDMDEGWEQLKAKVSMVPDVNGATPTDVRSFQMMTAGLSPEQVNDARLINLGLKGRASNAGYGFFEFDGADGRKRMGRNNPRTGDREVYDEATGDFVPLGGGAGIGIGSPAAAQPQTGQHFGDFTSLAGEFPGVSMTSGMRTTERNQEVGGAANSQHLTGTAADYAVPAQLKPAFISRAKQLGYQAIDEGDHIHLQLPRGGRTGASAGLAVGRRKEDEARAVAQAQADVELSNLPTELNMRTDAALREAGGKAAIETGAKRQAVQAENDRSFNLYDTAMSGVSEGLGSSMTGPLAGRLPAVTAGQQIAEGGVAAIAPVLKQLFRSAGEGTFTDKDQELLLAMIPTRTDLPEARDWKIENIDRIVREKLGQPKKGGQSRPAQAQPASNDFSNLWN